MQLPCDIDILSFRPISRKPTFDLSNIKTEVLNIQSWNHPTCRHFGWHASSICWGAFSSLLCILLSGSILSRCGTLAGRILIEEEVQLDLKAWQQKSCEGACCCAEWRHLKAPVSPRGTCGPCLLLYKLPMGHMVAGAAERAPEPTAPAQSPDTAH